VLRKTIGSTWRTLSFHTVADHESGYRNVTNPFWKADEDSWLRGEAIAHAARSPATTAPAARTENSRRRGRETLTG
jgi:hypothetical protein